jgi:hypothetical protein
VITVRRIIFALFAFALSLQGVAAATMMHASAASPARHSDVDVANKMNVDADPAAVVHTEPPCEHATAVHTSRGDGGGDIKHASHSNHSDHANHANHANHTGDSTHADCAGALCCAAFISQSVATFRLPPARHAPDVAVDFAIVRIDPATFERPPRT